jgi:hypothetical protein
MPTEYRLTIRLTSELYTQLAACGSQGQPLSALVRQALLEYVARQTGQPHSAEETALTLASLAARLDGLQDQVETLATRLESLTANTRQTPAAMADTMRQTSADVADTIQQSVADVADTERQTPADMADMADTTGQTSADVADTTPRPRPRGHRPGIPHETLAAIADERTHCEGLSLRAFARRLYDKGIYRARNDKPVDAGTLARWLTQARAQGLL